MSTPQTKETTQHGSIVCVGVGMTLGSHICPLSRSYIEQADVVFCSMSNHFTELWVKEMNSDVRSLQIFYAEGKDRRDTYKEMVEAMMVEVRAGKKVVGAFYGHPGVFAWAPHKVIEVARSEGFDAHMEAGVSAEDCLYADLGIDPGKTGCQHFEASQFMFYERNIDAAAYLILWQVGIAGDRSAARFETTNVYRTVLKELLLEIYPSDHKVALYEAKTLPIDETRMDWIALSDFDKVVVNQHTTMAIPPAKKTAAQPQSTGSLGTIRRAERQMTAFYTQRLSHRLLEEQDVPFAASLYQDPNVMRKIGPVYTRDKAEKAMINAVKANHHSPPNLRIWLISERETEKAVGIQMLKWAKDKNDEAEIGIMLLPKANGKQYAFEGMGALVDIGFHQLNLTHIYARFNPTNIPVKKFVDNLGFRIETKKEYAVGESQQCHMKIKEWSRPVKANIPVSTC